MTKSIPLTNGKVTLVDDGDFDWLNQWKWQGAKSRTFYAVRRAGWPVRKTVIMHRLILGISDEYEVDYINGNGLDNRRKNLRVATRSQNQANRGPQRNNASGYKGVMWNKGKRKWRARIQVEGRRIHLGYFDDPVEAAKAYDEAARKHFGKFAKTNF